jgi:hypothetical protein
MYDVGKRGWLLTGMLLACRWVLDSGISTVVSWPKGLVEEMVFCCVKYELIRVKKLDRRKLLNDIYIQMMSCDRSLIGCSLMLTRALSFSEDFIASVYYLSYSADFCR